VSGVGLGAGWFGAIVGLAAIAPFVRGPLAAVQNAGRANAFLPSALIAAAFLTISLVLLRRQALNLPPNPTTSVGAGRILRDQWRSIRGATGLLAFYLFFFVTSDSFGTIQQNMSIYLERVLRLSDSNKTVLLGIVLVGMAFGAIVSGVVARRRSLRHVLGAWVIGCGASLLWFASSSTWRTVLPAGVAVGVTMGAVLALTRALAVELIPATARASQFGVYSALDRLSALIGPMLWAAVLVLPLSVPEVRYRLAIGLLAVLVLGSILFLRRTRANGLGASV
jgi:UMF1 family MFS transporter